MKLLAALAGLFLFVGTAHAQDIYRISTVQAVTVASTTTPADAVFGSQTRAVRVISTVVAHIVIGASPQTATTSDTYLAAAEAEYFIVPPGGHIAVIRASGDGTLYVTELTK